MPQHRGTFWQAGVYETKAKQQQLDCLQAARVHPKFLHSNATSHEGVLGAIAELLDNSIDEIPKGCTSVSVDIEDVNGEPILTVQDDGGGMTRHHLHRMMSFGMSDGKEGGDRIGQYGNGFKTSSMRLGADALVMTKKDGEKSCGLLSFSFLKSEGYEDVVVPLVSWDANDLPLDNGKGRAESLSLVCRWSPFASEEALLELFHRIGDHGTVIFISSLYLNGDGSLELDIQSDSTDIRTRPGDKQQTSQAEEDSTRAKCMKRYYGWRTSLRRYCSILYKKLPPNFAIRVRGKKVRHVDMTADLRYHEKVNYTPNLPRTSGKDYDGVYPITIGFVEEAPHAPIMGVNVYYRNRLIMGMWEPYNSPSSKGRGVLAVLEVDFVQPTHSKQKFENTELFQRLENKLKLLIPAYWTRNAKFVGYQIGSDKKKAKHSQEHPAAAPEPEEEQEHLGSYASPPSPCTPTRGDGSGEAPGGAAESLGPALGGGWAPAAAWGGGRRRGWQAEEQELRMGGGGEVASQGQGFVVGHPVPVDAEQREAVVAEAVEAGGWGGERERGRGALEAALAKEREERRRLEGEVAQCEQKLAEAVAGKQREARRVKELERSLSEEEARRRRAEAEVARLTREAEEAAREAGGRKKAKVVKDEMEGARAHANGKERRRSPVSASLEGGGKKKRRRVKAEESEEEGTEPVVVEIEDSDDEIL